MIDYLEGKSKLNYFDKVMSSYLLLVALYGHPLARGLS